MGKGKSDQKVRRAHPGIGTVECDVPTLQIFDIGVHDHAMLRGLITALGHIEIVGFAADMTLFTHDANATNNIQCSVLVGFSSAVGFWLLTMRREERKGKGMERKGKERGLTLFS